MPPKNLKHNLFIRAGLLATASLFFVLSLKTAAYSVSTYPQIDVTGYKQYSYTSLNVDEIQNHFQAQAMLGGYYAGGPWQERLKLRIVGKLTEKLSVSYDLDQQPDMPDKFDVKVTYDKTELTFGDFQANFSDNEFVSTSKYLNGIMVTSKDNWYDLLLVPSSKLKSETQRLVSQRGNNTKGPYNLGHGSIIEGSEKIELNNVPLTRGADYSIDYFGGKITYARILSPDDEFKYSYEFTNMIDLFFPTVSKRDFMGLQTSITVDPSLLGIPAKKTEKAIKQNLEIFPTQLNIPVEKISKEVVALPPHVRTEATSEALNAYVVYINDIAALTLHEISGETPANIRADLIKNKLDSIIISGITTNEINSIFVNGEVVLVAGSRPIATVLRSEAKVYDISTDDLAAKWKEGIISGLSATPEVVTIFVTPETKIEEYEWESTGTYRLNKTPVIPYSEKLTFIGTQLKKFEDYIINYQDGTITLLRPNLPTVTESLIVEYQYIDVTEEAETLPGNGKGPYVLSSKDMVEGSELVYINNIPYIRELDYKIDYDLGRISFFTDIPQTASIVVKYKHLVTTTPPPPPTAVVPRYLNIGVIYLKESGKRGATAPNVAATETRSYSDIINNNNAIYLSFRPVTDTSEVEVRKNDILQVYGTDYVFPTVETSTGNVIPATKLAYICDPADRSDGLKTGTIKFLGALAVTDEVVVSYDYSKWSTDRYAGSGGSSTMTYYLGSFRNLVPGAEEVQIWRKNVSNPIIKKLIRNSSIEVYDGHYSINYSDPPSITFNNDPIVVDGEIFYLNDINFTVIFKFVAQTSASERPISHDVVGSDFTFKVGDYLNFNGAFAKSRTDQVYTTVSTNESFNGNGSSKIFNLKSPAEIIDGSEQVYLNGQKLNRDDQYSFFYDSNSSGKYGIVTFFIITPATADGISIDYNYQSTAGIVTTFSEKQGSAYKLGGSIKPMSNLEFAADYKKVDADFSPMGGTSIPLGSEYKHAYTKMTPLPSFWSSWWLSGDLKESNTPINNYPDKFLHAYDRNYSTGLNPFGLAQVDFGFREYTTTDDLLPASTTHNNDYKSLAYSLSMVPRPLSYGIFAFSNRNDARKTLSYTDTEDKQLPKDSITDYYHTNNTFEFTRRVKWVLDYQVNQPSTISYEAGSRSQGKTIQRQETDDLSSNFNWDMTFGNIRKLYTYWNKIGHNEYDFILGTARSTVNETYHADFVPIDQVTTSLDHNRQEIPTVSTAYGNPKTERSAANVRLTPYSSTTLGWSGSVDDSLQENGAKTSGNANNYSIDHTPLSGSNYKLTTKYNLAQSLRKAPFGSAEVTTDTRTFSQDYNVTVTPTPVWSLTTGILQEDYTNKNDAPTTPIDTKSQGQTTKVGSSYKMTEDLDLSGNYSVKVTRTPDQSAHKALLDAHAIYKVFTYGTVNYDWTQEENEGEILGGAFVDQDFTKIIQSLSLNVVMPQSEQMILSSIVLKAAVKWANFMDRNAPTNSFQATLLSFEGTFNF